MKKAVLTLLAAIGATISMTAGDGTINDPYTVDELIEKGAPATAIPNVYVKGYIVGYVPGMTYSETIFGLPESSDAQKTNVVMASSSAEDLTQYCIPVQLPSGAARNAINLVDNPGNLGREILICGSNEKYFGTNGMKSISYYAFDGQKPEILPEVVTELNESFSSIPTNWTNTGNPAFYATTYNNEPYAAVTGYNKTAPFDSWLISPAVDMSKVEKKSLSFETQVNGYGSTTTTFKAYILDGKDPATAKKTEINCTYATAPESGYSGFVKSGDIDLSSYSGQIYIGFNYVAEEDANYATWCVTNVLLNSEGGSTPVDPGNKGTMENPLSVAELMANACPAKDAGVAGWYVKGYIVGFIPDKSADGAIFGPASADSQNTNIILADSKDCTNIKEALPVQLPTGAVRDALNLVDNPDNLGREVILCGTYETYFSQAGLKKVTSYSFDGKQPESPYIYSTLVSNDEGWTVEYASELPEAMSYVWKWDAAYTNYKASAYVNNVNYAVTATAITPEVDLTNYTDVELTFDHAGKFFDTAAGLDTQAQVLVREIGGEWAQLPITTWFTNADWKFVSNTCDLSAYDGKKVQFGLRYISSETAAGTWEVKNFNLKGNSTAVETITVAPLEVRVVNGSIVAPAEAEVYNAAGLRAGRENLQKGIYIVRLGNKVAKVLVK